MHTRLLPLAAAALLLAASPNVADLSIQGGTPAQHKQLRDVLATLPACFMRCSATPVKFDIRRSDSGAAGYNDKLGRVDISDVLFGGAAYQRHFKQLTKREPCLNEENAAWLEDLRRSLLHELSHHVHDTCHGGNQPDGGKLMAFLQLPGGYQDKMKKLNDDRELERLEDAMDEALKSTSGACAAQARMIKRVQELGFASRGVGDEHSSSDGGGGEYIAVAIETLFYDHAEFCRAYSPAEIQWLKANLGDCLGQLANRAPCYDAPASPAPLEVIDTLNGLMRATRPGDADPGCDE